jgi:hypothetical protein
MRFQENKRSNVPNFPPAANPIALTFKTLGWGFPIFELRSIFLRRPLPGPPFFVDVGGIFFRWS